MGKIIAEQPGGLFFVVSVEAGSVWSQILSTIFKSTLLLLQILILKVNLVIESYTRNGKGRKMALSLLCLKKALLDIHLGSQIVKQQRSISTSAALLGKRNFRKFHLGNKRGTRFFKRDRNAGKFPDIPIETEVQPMGFKYGDTFQIVPEMIPKFVVPDLTGCELQPYVSYRTADIYQEAFTPEQLFQAVYEGKIRRDLEEGKLDGNGNPTEPSPAESLTPDEAWIQARKTGSDIFSERIPKLWECLDIDVVEWDNKRKQKWSEDYAVEKKLTELE